MTKKPFWLLKIYSRTLKWGVQRYFKWGNQNSCGISPDLSVARTLTMVFLLNLIIIPVYKLLDIHKGFEGIL